MNNFLVYAISLEISTLPIDPPKKMAPGTFFPALEKRDSPHRKGCHAHFNSTLKKWPGTIFYSLLEKGGNPLFFE
jgi:hypothetical protein